MSFYIHIIITSSAYHIHRHAVLQYKSASIYIKDTPNVQPFSINMELTTRLRNVTLNIHNSSK